MAADGFAPLAHQVVQRGLLAVVGHPAWGAESGEGLRGPAPTVAGDRPDEVGIVECDAGERVGRPEGLRIVNLARPDGFEDGFVFGVVAKKDMLAKDAGDDAGADPYESILGVEVVEGRILRVVELVDDETPDGFGVLVPATCLVPFAEGIGHVAQSGARSVHGSREIGAEARHGGNRRALACVGVGTLVGNAAPSGGVVLAGVVGAEALDQAGLAGVAVSAEPCVPAAAGTIGSSEQLLVTGELGKLPRRGRYGNDHLDLTVTDTGCFDGGGKLTIFLLQREEGHVIVTGDVQRDEFAADGIDVWRKCAVDEAFVWAALLPDPRVDRPFDQNRLVIAGHSANVAGKRSHCSVPCVLPARIFAGKCWCSGSGCRRGLRLCCRWDHGGTGCKRSQFEKLSSFHRVVTGMLLPLGHEWDKYRRRTRRR